jgi:tetrahydrodipicolinate N-succinyltransferase
MQLVSGRVTEIYIEEGVMKAKVSIGGAFLHIPRMLLMDVHVGDDIIVSAGVAVAKSGSHTVKETENVPGNSR